MISFIVPGEPKGKGRPRMSTRTGKAFTPKDTLLYENLVKMQYMNCVKDKYIEGNVRAYITCYYGIPKSYSKKKRISALMNEIRPNKKPDIDNCIKVILDSLNGLAYKDDAQVVEVVAKKFYAENGLVKIELEEI